MRIVLILLFSVYENCIYHFMAEGVLLNSAHANGGPCSWVFACKTLCSAPIDVSENFPARVSAESGTASKKKSNWNFPIGLGGWVLRGVIFQFKKKCCFKMIYML